MEKTSKPRDAARPPEERQGPGLKWAWFCFFLIIPAYMFSMFYRMVPNVLALDIAADLDMPATEIAVLSAAAMMSYGVMQLPSGLLADAFGGKKVLCAFTAIAGASTLWFGLTDSVVGVTVSRFVTGIGLAVTIPCLTLIARWFPPRLFSRVASVLLATGTCGTLVAAAPLAGASNIWGWRAVLVFCGFFSLGLSLLMGLLLRDGARESSAPAGPDAREGGAENAVGAIGRKLKRLLSTREFWPLFIGFSAMCIVYFSFATLWWGPYLMQGCGMSKTEAGNVLFLGTLASIPAMPVLAALSEKLRSRKKVNVACACVMLGSVAVMSLCAGRLSVSAHIVFAVLFTSSCGTSAVALASGKELFPPDMVGTVTGCLNSVPPMTAALHQKVFGEILQGRLTAHAQDYAAAYGETLFLNIAFLVVAVFALALSRETFPQNPRG